MITTAALAESLDAASPLVPPLDDQLPSYQELVSDHLPLVARLAH